MGKMGFGGFSKSSLFGGRGNSHGKGDRDHGRDDDDQHGHGPKSAHQPGGCNDGAAGGNGSGNGGANGGGNAGGGNNFAAIPPDTLGVTFTIDLGRDGTDDDYFVVKAPEGVDPAKLTMQSYYDTVAKDIAAKYPDVPPGQLVVKATVYSASQGESYQYFKGTETTTDQQNAGNNDDDDDDDHHGGGHNGGGHHGGGQHGGGQNGGGQHGGGKDDNDHHGGGKPDAACDKDAKDQHDDKGGKSHGGDFGDFYAKLMAYGAAPSEDDHGSHDDDDADEKSDDLIFC